nr:hypothetical protein [Tanacetum cinerariifolium]
MENIYLKHGLISKTYYKNSSSWHQLLASNPIFYDHVSFHLKYEIDRIADGKLRNKNTDESWEIIENLALYDHEGWNDIKVFAKPVKAISTPQGTSKTLDQRLLKLADHIYLLLEGEEEEKNDKYNVATGGDSKETDGPDKEVSVKEAKTKNEAKNGAKNKPIKKPEKEEVVEAPSSRHELELEKKTYNVLPRGPVYEAILKKKITKKEDIKGNIKIPCIIGGLKHVNALVDQGSNVNAMPYSTYMKLIIERHAETDIRLSLASHSYIYPLGIAEHILVEIIEHVYPVEFVILDIKEDKNRPFIL